MLRESLRDLEIVTAQQDDSCSSCERELDAGQLAIEGPSNTLFCSLGCADRAVSFQLEHSEMWEAMV